MPSKLHKFADGPWQARNHRSHLHDGCACLCRVIVAADLHTPGNITIISHLASQPCPKSRPCQDFPTGSIDEIGIGKQGGQVVCIVALHNTCQSSCDPELCLSMSWTSLHAHDRLNQLFTMQSLAPLLSMTHTNELLTCCMVPIQCAGVDLSR